MQQSYGGAPGVGYQSAAGSGQVYGGAPGGGYAMGAAQPYGGAGGVGYGVGAQPAQGQYAGFPQQQFGRARSAPFSSLASRSIGIWELGGVAQVAESPASRRRRGRCATGRASVPPPTRRN